jgi:hypothetical protein
MALNIDYTKYQNLPNMTSQYLNEQPGGAEKMDKFYMFLQKTLHFPIVMEFIIYFNTQEILDVWKENLPDIWEVFDSWIKVRQQKYR